MVVHPGYMYTQIPDEGPQTVMVHPFIQGITELWSPVCKWGSNYNVTDLGLIISPFTRHTFSSVMSGSSPALCSGPDN